MELYRLEIMKLRLPAYLWAILGIFLSLTAFGIMSLFLGVHAPVEELLFTDWQGIYALLTALTFACFSVFSAVMSARMIVDEYCGKHASVLFTYPIGRKKLFVIKCRIILFFTIVPAFGCNVFAAGILYLVSGIFGITPKLTGEHFVLLVLFSSLLVGLLAFEAALICAWTGFKKRSVITTILCSLILVCFLPNLMAGLPKGIAWVMVILSALLGLAAFILYHLLAKEIERMEI